ncbi:MAG: hypothetical protein AAFU69_12700 [Pseudomonadota bacterium]
MRSGEITDLRPAPSPEPQESSFADRPGEAQCEHYESFSNMPLGLTGKQLTRNSHSLREGMRVE